MLGLESLWKAVLGVYSVSAGGAQNNLIKKIVNVKNWKIKENQIPN